MRAMVRQIAVRHPCCRLQTGVLKYLPRDSTILDSGLRIPDPDFWM
jgi:hypothetical protein